VSVGKTSRSHSSDNRKNNSGTGFRWDRFPIMEEDRPIYDDINGLADLVRTYHW